VDTRSPPHRPSVSSTRPGPACSARRECGPAGQPHIQAGPQPEQSRVRRALPAASAHRLPTTPTSTYITAMASSRLPIRVETRFDRPAQGPPLVRTSREPGGATPDPACAGSIRRVPSLRLSWSLHPLSSGSKRRDVLRRDKYHGFWAAVMNPRHLHTRLAATFQSLRPPVTRVMGAHVLRSPGRALRRA
jgi:hypothetical protein